MATKLFKYLGGVKWEINILISVFLFPVIFLVENTLIIQKGCFTCHKLLP